MPIHRTLKNVVKNFTFAEVKVREATSNDPWGPSTTLMSEIADLTYNVMAFTEIMQMIWKRLNDHGKNWRHVYKSLVLLDYLLKTGSERVAQQCRENLLTIQTLKDFQYNEDGKDHGQNVREKSKALVALLKDDERFKNERTKALAAKERFAQNTGGGGMRKETSKMPHSSSDRYLYGSSTQHQSGSTPPLSSDLEAVRPSSYGEEDLQLQLALAMSKEEHDEEVKRRKGDELKLQMAIEESQKTDHESPQKQDHLLELESGNAAAVGAASKMPSSVTWDGQLSNHGVIDPWSPKPTSVPATDPWGIPASVPPAQPSLPSQPSLPQPVNDPWSATSAPVTTGGAVDSSVHGAVTAAASPWDPVPSAGPPNGAHAASAGKPATAGVDDEFDLLFSRSKSPPTMTAATDASSDGLTAGGAGSAAAWNMSELEAVLGGTTSEDIAASKKKATTAEEFLGSNAGLVNLNELIVRPPPSTIINPFAMTTAPAGNTRTQSPAANLFATRAQQEEQSKRVPINQMAKPQPSTFTAPPAASTQLPTPLMPGSGWQPAASTAIPPQPIVQPNPYAPVGIAPYPQSQNPFL